MPRSSLIPFTLGEVVAFRDMEAPLVLCITHKRFGRSRRFWTRKRVLHQADYDGRFKDGVLSVP